MSKIVDDNVETNPGEASSRLIFGCVAAVALLAIGLATALPKKSNSQSPTTALASSSTLIAPFTAGHLCRATISILMGRPLKIIGVDNETKTSAEVSYHRPDDNSLWQQKCKVVGNRIVWGAIDGRWRDNASWDEVLVFAVDPQKQSVLISQKFDDGKSSDEIFHLTEFD